MYNPPGLLMQRYGSYMQLLDLFHVADRQCPLLGNGQAVSEAAAVERSDQVDLQVGGRGGEGRGGVEVGKAAAVECGKQVDLQARGKGGEGRGEAGNE